MAAEQARRRGPRPRGDRVSVTMRIPDAHAEAYRSKAEELGIPLSSWIALALAEHTGLDVPTYVQDELRKVARQRALEAIDLELGMPQSA